MSIKCVNIIGRWKSGCSADGSALEWGSRGRWFNSSHSDQYEQSSQCGGCFFRSGDRDQRPLANSNPPLGVPNAKRRHAAGSTPVTRTNMNSCHSVAAVFSFRRKGTGGKFKFATDLPDIVLTCALQQNRQTKAHKFANFHYLSGKQNVV